MNKIKISVLLLFFVTFSIFSQEKKYTTYQAQKGETIQTISVKFAITPYSLLQLNPDLKNGISENQLIIVPNKNYKPELNKEIEGDYVKDGFLYHKVLPKENFYRLKKKFGVPKRILRKHNLSLRIGGLKAGEVIKIPVKEGFKLAPSEVALTDTKLYIVKPRETKYKISRRYGISIERLEELNPEIKENGLKMAQIIKVPNTNEIPDEDEEFVTHKIEKNETLFSLGQQFKISQEQLIELNPELKDGVNEGALIKIPLGPFEENTSVFVANIPADTQLKIAMMLPFTGRKSSLDFEKNKTLDRVTDFYLGALMALDSVKKQGVSVSVKVFDTQNNPSTLSNILRMNSFNDIDAIIGPMFLNNVKFVSQNLRLDSVAIISPASSKDHAVFASKSVIKEVPSDDLLAAKVLNYMESNYNKQHIVVIADDKEENESKISELVTKLNLLDSIQKVEVLKPEKEKGYIKSDLFKTAIAEDKENWIVLITDEDEKGLTANVVNALGVLPEEFNITLFCLNRGENFEKTDNNFLARVNFHYPTANFVDYENYEVEKFLRKYKSVNHAEPSEYAFKGFDITYDALLRLATYTDVENAFDGGISERLSSKFLYIKKQGKGFENKGVFLIKYDGLNLVNTEKVIKEKME